MKTEDKDTSSLRRRLPTRTTVEGVSQSPQGKEANEVRELKRALAEERARADAYFANWRRSQSDFANHKRRVEQEREEATKLANAMLIINLLPALDDLERALDCVSPKLSGLTWVDGVRQIRRKFQAILEANGLSAIRAEGQMFDPSLHEAIMDVDGEEGHIVEEVQKGYRLFGRVIRPALVKVGRKSEVIARELEEKTDPS